MPARGALRRATCARAAPIPAREACRSSRFSSMKIDATLTLCPVSSSSCDLGTIAFASHHAFYKLSFSARLSFSVTRPVGTTTQPADRTRSSCCSCRLEPLAETLSETNALPSVEDPHPAHVDCRARIMFGWRDKLLLPSSRHASARTEFRGNPAASDRDRRRSRTRVSCIKPVAAQIASVQLDWHAALTSLADPIAKEKIPQRLEDSKLGRATFGRHGAETAAPHALWRWARNQARAKRQSGI